MNSLQNRRLTLKNVRVNPAGVAAPAGQYSQSVRIPLGESNLIIISGQVALDQHGSLVGEGDVTLQTRQVFENLKTILEANGASFADVVKLNLYVTDISKRGEVAEVRKQYLTNEPPASTFVEVSRLASDDWLIEVEATAVVHN